ncbi:FGGY family carbohydrate kinase [Streptomyces sp. CRN 30]|uniref:FGGY family carbohydrate kinase n=1 Tax=Streptomyces sp. CRN 30 TaxID=3075613 RepID=UPI002A800D48|nr:FGGY family carbohydrate kinase [Streptomyces sp. CRN 30]
MGPYVLAVDQGTGSTKALLLDTAGAVVARAAVPLAETHPGPGLVEQDPGALVDSVRTAVAACLEGHDPHSVEGLALSTQRESVVLWEAATGRPVAPLVSWQDQRGGDRLARLARAGAGAEIQRRTGLPLDPMFSAPKMAALLDAHDPDRALSGAGTLRLGTVDAYLLHTFTGRADTEIGNASRTQLLDLATGDWDDGLLAAFDVPRAALGRVVPSDGPFGTVRGLPPLADGTPLRAVLGDSHAALFAHAGWRPGTVKVTYGTGSSAMTVGEPEPAGAPEPAGEVCGTIAWSTGRPVHAREANIRSTGRTLAWLGALLGVPAAGIVELAEGADAGEVTLVPAFGGLGAPWWDARAVPVLTGFGLDTGRERLARAALDSVAYQVNDVLAALPPARRVVADGGLSRSDVLMRTQADVSDVVVARAAHHDLSAAGAAHLAGLGLGLWTRRDLEERADRDLCVFAPSGDAAARTRTVARWHRALAAARDLGARPSG